MLEKYWANFLFFSYQILASRKSLKPTDTYKVSDETKSLYRLEVSSSSFFFLAPNQGEIFKIKGFNKLGNEIDPGLINWQAEGGDINNAGKLIVASTAKGIFKVTATSVANNLSCSVTYTVMPKLTSIKITPLHQHNLFRKLLVIKISFTIFSWIISQKKFIKDIASYCVQELFSLEIAANEDLFSVSENNAVDSLNILISDSIKDWVIEAVVNIIIDYLDKFISLCFNEDFDPLVCSKSYIVLPELKKLVICPANIDVRPRDTIDFQLIGLDQKGLEIKIERKVSWKATGGQISDSGRLIVYPNSQGSFIVRATIGNRLDTSIKYNVLAELKKIRKISPSGNTDWENIDLSDIPQLDDIDIEEINFEGIDLEENYGRYIYVEEEIKEEYLDRNFKYYNLSWFYKSQLLYDGYSEQDYSSYTDYLDYIDLRDYNSYRNN